MKTLIFVLAVAFSWVGFVDSSRSQAESKAEPTSLVAPDDQALVVFVRPKRTPVINFYVFDEKRKLRTLFKNKEYAAITVEPGKHTLYVVAENAELIRLEAVAGRTYVIHAYPKMGFGKARVGVEPARRNSPNFKEMNEWFHKTKRGEPDFKKGEKWTSKRQAALERRMTAAEEDWAKMDEEEQEKLTLRPDDGLSADQAKELAP